jgi:hypothetical protein
MMGLWTRFAATGDPGDTTTTWPRYTSTEPLLRIDEPRSIQIGWRNAECDFWDQLGGVMVPPPP